MVNMYIKTSDYMLYTVSRLT